MIGYDPRRDAYLIEQAEADNNARACGEDPSFRSADRPNVPAVDAGGSLPLAAAAGPAVLWVRVPVNDRLIDALTKTLCRGEVRGVHWAELASLRVQLLCARMVAGRIA